MLNWLRFEILPQPITFNLKEDVTTALCCIPILWIVGTKWMVSNTPVLIFSENGLYTYIYCIYTFNQLGKPVRIIVTTIGIQSEQLDSISQNF